VPRLFYALLAAKTEIITGFFEALRFIPNVLKKRAVEKKFFVISDKELFSLFTGEPIKER
jgi:hypothetical protein